MDKANLVKKLHRFDCGCEWEVAMEGNDIVGVNFEPEKANINCSKVWELLSSGKTKGIFQLESPLGQSTSHKCRPSNIEELSDVNSILRPGCGDSIIDGKTLKQHYIDRKNGDEEPIPPHPLLSGILKDTQGIFIYQEQAMAAAKEVAGFSGEESDSLRKAIGKKLADKMAELKGKFIGGCQEHSKFSKKEAEDLFSILEAGQRYSFNKCLCPDTTIVQSDLKGMVPLKSIEIGELIKDHKGNFVKVVDIYHNGVQPLYTIYIGSCSISCTLDHELLTEHGITLSVNDILNNRFKVFTEHGYHYIDMIKFWTYKETIDIEVDNHDHVFMANGIGGKNSHSISYALDALHFSAYAKTHFPHMFFLSELEYSRSHQRKTVVKVRGEIIDDARNFGVKIKGPNLNLKNESFLLKNRIIYYGLGKIKGVGGAKYRKFMDEVSRHNKLTWGILLYCLSKTGSDAANSLIKSGALDFTLITRTKMLFEFSVFSKLTSKQQDFAKDGELSLLENIDKIIGQGTGKGSLLYNKTSIKKINETKKTLETPPTSMRDTKAKLFKWEIELLGFAFTCTEIDNEEVGNCNCKEFLSNKTLDEYQIPGIIDNVKLYITKGKQPGQEMAFVDFKDKTQKLSAVVFPNILIDTKGLLFEGNKAVFIGKRGQKDSLVVNRVIQI